jgi:hypothetical protein
MFLERTIMKKLNFVESSELNVFAGFNELFLEVVMD